MSNSCASEGESRLRHSGSKGRAHSTAASWLQITEKSRLSRPLVDQIGLGKAPNHRTYQETQPSAASFAFETPQQELDHKALPLVAAALTGL